MTKTVESDNEKTTGKPKMKSTKLTKSNDAVMKANRTISGSVPDKIEVNPTMSEAAGEHTAVTNLNMRAQPLHKGHQKVIQAVEKEAQRVGGSAHIVTSHSEGDDKNPIPSAEKVGYIKKIAAPGTHVSATSKQAPSIFHTAARLNRHAHHLVVVAGSDRAGEYEKLLHKYNGKEGPHGYYNFKSIKVKAIGRDPDASGTEGVSGTKMRQHAKEGNIKAFKSGLPSELHGHAEEMMNHINKAAKKSFKESVNELFEEITNTASSGAIRGLGNVTGNVSGDEEALNAYVQGNIADADTKDNILKMAKKASHDDLHTKKEETERTLNLIENAFEAVEKFGKNREAVARSGQKPQDKDLVTRAGDRKKEDKAYRTQSLFKQVYEAMKQKKSGWDKIWNKNTIAGRKMIAASDRAAEAAKALRADATKRSVPPQITKEETQIDEKRGLWDNIWAKRKRIKAGSGEHMRRPGEKGRPTAKDLKDSQK